MPYQSPPALWLGTIKVTLQIQNTWPQMHELVSGPYSVFLVVFYRQFLQGFIITSLEVPIVFDCMFEADAAFAITTEEEPVGAANFIGVLGWYVGSIEQN
jgi:hypothetical protein